MLYSLSIKPSIGYNNFTKCNQYFSSKHFQGLQGQVSKFSRGVSQIAMAQSALDETSKDGAFKRTAAQFRNHIKEGTEFEPEADRYHLYISYACPWASRALAVMYMKGLEDVIGLSIVHPTWAQTRPGQDQHTGWQFTNPDDPPVSSTLGHGSFGHEGVIPDSINGTKFVRDIYEKTGADVKKFTVPLLWDKKTNTIVNNESSELIRMFNSEFNSLAKYPDVDIYPEELRSEIDAVNEWVYPGINDGVYRCGFATKQGAYEEAFKSLFAALDKAEEVLSKSRYLCGSKLTEADIRLFVTLIRFDPVYVVYFKTNKRFISDYPALREFTKELYQIPEIQKSVNMYHIKTHYFTSHPALNTYGIIPVGPDPWWEEPHNRADMA